MDNMKALMIYLVVFGHMLECFNGTIRWWIYLTIYSFHMPVFAYITGYFSRINPERTIRGILYPYFLYQTLYLVSAIFSGTGKYFSIYNAVLAFMVSDFVVMLADAVTSD